MITVKITLNAMNVLAYLIYLFLTQIHLPLIDFILEHDPKGAVRGLAG